MVMNPSDAPERDPSLERAWRAHSRETPPSELDRAILAAAHRAVGSGPQEAAKPAEATRPQRWWMPLAAAATIGVIAIGILQLTSPDQSLVAPNERVAAVARHSAEEKSPAPAVSQSATDAMKERDAAAPATRNDLAGVEQKKKQEALPASPVPAAPPQKPAAPIERQAPLVTGNLTARAPESHPEPFPGAADARKNAGGEMKRDAAADTAAKAAEAIAPAPAVAPQTPPPATAEERAAARKDTPLERQQLAAATDKTTAGAASGRSGAAAERDVSSFASAPAPPLASPRARESGLARNEAPVQAAPAAAPPPAVAKTLALTDELRAKARDPDAWIMRIRKLRDEGNTAEALRELREFRDLVPDAEQRLPADLMTWANNAKP
jgi:hypothetical protein